MLPSDSHKTTHEVIFGDCLGILPTFPEESFELIFADPPYGLAKKKGLGWKYSKHITLEEQWDIFSKDDFFKFNVKWIQECFRVLKHGGSLWVCGSFHNIYQLGNIMQTMTELKINNSIVWFKPNAQPNISCRMFTESCEHLIWATKNGKGKRWTFNYEDTKKLIHDNPKAGEMGGRAPDAEANGAAQAHHPCLLQARGDCPGPFPRLGDHFGCCKDAGEEFCRN